MGESQPAAAQDYGAGDGDDNCGENAAAQDYGVGVKSEQSAFAAWVVALVALAAVVVALVAAGAVTVTVFWTLPADAALAEGLYAAAAICASWMNAVV